MEAVGGERKGKVAMEGVSEWLVAFGMGFRIAAGAGELIPFSFFAVIAGVGAGDGVCTGYEVLRGKQT